MALAAIGLCAASGVGAVPTLSWQEFMGTDRAQSTAVLDALTMSDGSEVSLRLEPFDVMSSDGIVIIQSRAGQQAVQARDIVHLYRGHVVAAQRLAAPQP